MARYYKVVSENRKARHDYNIIEVYKAGIELKGTEVKSVRLGKVNLRDSFGRAEAGELWLYNMHISPYEKGNIYNVNPKRKRKLLLKGSEIKKLIGKVNQRGFVLVPLKIYFDGDYAKVELALAKAKKLYEKREVLRERAAKREIDRTLKDLKHKS